MKIYTGRFGNDHSFEVVVLKQTEKTVTFIHPHTKTKKRAKIHYQYAPQHIHQGAFFMPFGKYSMSPVIRL